MVLAFNIAYFAVLAMALPLSFEENDDVMMAMIANGTYSGTPDCHLVFINVIYGWVLTLLYGLTTAVEWYTLSFAVLHILSMSVLAYCILTTPNRSNWERALWLLILYVLWARIIIALQFTTTAGITCLAGCVLLLRESKRARWAGVLFVIVAALVRFVSAGLVGVLMAPIILYTYRLNWRKYIPVVIMLAAVVGCRVTNHKVYDHNPEWKYFRAYNQVRAHLTDNPNAYQLQPDQLPQGVEWVDYQLLMRFIPDPQQIDLPTIRKISAVVGGVPFRMQLQNLYRLSRYAVELVILMGLLVLMIITTGNRSKFIFLVLYTLFIIVLMVHVSLDGFLKNRVFICILLPLLMTDFMLLPDTTGLKRRWGIAVAILALCGWYSYQIYEQREFVTHRELIWSEFQQPLLEHVPEGASLVSIGAGLRVEADNPWHIWPYPFYKYTLGWLTWIPLNKPVGHSYRAFLRDDVYIFTDRRYEDHCGQLQLVREQLETDYGVPTEVVWKCRNGLYSIVQLKVKE